MLRVVVHAVRVTSGLLNGVAFCGPRFASLESLPVDLGLLDDQGVEAPLPPSREQRRQRPESGTDQLYEMLLTGATMGTALGGGGAAGLY
tara:strand:- start:90 stop:359 length:270 start_codon:yes stop_codon:yes gene_type:complete